MSTPLLQLNHYFGIRQQPLHRVLIYAPTLIWVQQGHKQLWWQERRLSFDKRSWLLIPAGHQLTFVNQPEQGKFSSHALTLLAPPPAEWLTGAPATPQREPRLEISPALAFCFELVCSMAGRTLSEATQIQLLHAFYAELHAAHALDLLFPASTMTLGERLARYLGVEPGADHRLETLAPPLFHEPRLPGAQAGRRGAQLSPAAGPGAHEPRPHPAATGTEPAGDGPRLRLRLPQSLRRPLQAGVRSDPPPISAHLPLNDPATPSK